MKTRVIHQFCNHRFLPWTFLLPGLVGTCLFYLVPFLEITAWSFSDARRSSFVMLDNYKSVLQNSAFRLAVKNTLCFLGVCLPLLLGVGLLLAWLLWLLLPHSRYVQPLLLLPPALPVAGIALTWKILFENGGLLNSWLEYFGLPSVSFLKSGAVFWVLVATFIWKNLGYTLLIWMAGLSSIPKDLYEAAAIDGAGLWRSFLCITLPALPPSLGLASLFGIIGCFRVFREAWLLAGNYPPDSIYLLPHLLNNWFLALDMQRLSAAVMLVLSVFGGMMVAVRSLMALYRRQAGSDACKP